MNPLLDLNPQAHVATPKGQRLFDFWHQKLEQQASAATAHTTLSAPPDQSRQGASPDPTSMQHTDAGQQQLSAAPAALLAELESASRLVHTQSAQQAELLAGLEHALAQLSEHRLLIQHPQAAAAVHDKAALHIGMLLEESPL